MEGGDGVVVGEPVVPINNVEAEDVAILVEDIGVAGGQRWYLHWCCLFGGGGEKTWVDMEVFC